MDCCICQANLKCQARADLTYYECPQCGGLWFSPGELENLVSNRIRISLAPIPATSSSQPSAESPEPATPTAQPTTGNVQPSTPNPQSKIQNPKSKTDCPACGPGAHLVPMAMYATRHARLLGCPVCFGRWLSRDQAIIVINHVCYRGPLGWLHRLRRKSST